ncbi:hypothetical protein TVAG_013660 [Trichomonas vaginalis G3]|uniref:Calpain catalytic domain-containing protein n=1 Tax=Trichomonas vaginalis (strain ATCC PRA-98 / G3) TaxID=412133 RepID=A2DDC2_TRIV3|nr:calcium-dependent cysteine-type endopeptidase protein [Trichomonas vaginalis G3]EAY21601.1 hypothetical protein TVAG_013660 [Trichomonas vaginalis G3]KAI5489723.1 calcium-dependent cysteine-type endopeptidase protein [Trichomonas vaginalis G3]|eukprot:XP_001582587.1 hypothetical protein [Trichomonas vaginalis G3]
MRIILGVFAVIFIITSVIGSFAIWKDNKYNVCAVDAIVIFALGLSVVFFQIIRSHYRVDFESLIVTIFSCAVLYGFAFYLESTEGYSLLDFIYAPCGILLCLFVVYRYFDGGGISTIIQSVISVVLFAGITVFHFVRSGGVPSFIAGIILSIYICCILYCLLSLYSSKKGRKIAISNFFFPVFHYENRHLQSIPMLGMCFGYMFWVPLIFGTVLITYFTEPYWGFVLECCAFIVPFFIAYRFMITIDNESIDSFSYVKSRNSIDSTIANAMQAAETDYHHNSDSTKFYNYDDFITFIENDENANRQKSLFYSAFRTQLIIISDIITIKNMRQISSYIDSLGSKWKFMDDAVKKRILPPLEMRKQIAATVEIIEDLTETDETQIRQLISDVVKRGEKINGYVLKYLRQFTPTAVNSYYANAYKNLTAENNKMRFVDSYFAPGGEPAQIDTDILAKVKFYRAEDLYTGEFSKGTKEDIKSGNGTINDDAIASVLIAVQNKPDLDLDRFFSTPLLREKGLYMIKFNYKGTKAQVIIDSSVPYVERDSLLLEPTKRASSTFWFSLIEKAIAKMFGSYAQLDNCGLPSDIIPLFEKGVLRCYYMQTDEIREIAETGILFNQIYNAINNGGIACATRVTAEGISNYAITNCIYESDSTESLVLKGMKKYKGKTEFKVSLDTFLSDFRFVYTINDYPTWYLYELKFSFSAQEEKEVDPYDESKESLLEVPNIAIRCIKNDNHLLIGCQHQFPGSPVSAYLVYNYGRPIDRIYVGRDYRSFEFKAEEYCAGTTPFAEWDIKKKKMPWTLALVRKSLMVDSHCLFRIWSQNQLEFSLLETGTIHNTTAEIHTHEPHQ